MADLSAITEREIALIARFIELLQDEQGALRRADTEPLPTIGTEKVTLVEQLNKLENERRAALGLDAAEAPRAAMEKWLAANPAQKRAAQNWAKLLELANEARELHQLNAGLVAMHLQQTGEALNVLTTRRPADGLYGSDGQAAPPSGSRIVDSA